MQEIKKQMEKKYGAALQTHHVKPMKRLTTTNIKAPSTTSGGKGDSLTFPKKPTELNSPFPKIKEQ